MIQGTATCSRPAQILMSGILQQGGDKVLGSFQATVTCAVTTRWSAGVEVAPNIGKQARFTGGPATIVFNARGWPDAYPIDVTMDGGTVPVRLKGAARRQDHPGR